jgi:acyl-CoA thioesterase
VRPGYARATLTIGPAMINGLATAHGGILFTFADTALAFACNSRNDPHVALQCSISFINAARLGETIVAEAIECSLKGRTGVYDVTLTRGETTVALFRGVVYRVTGTVIPAAD